MKMTLNALDYGPFDVISGQDLEVLELTIVDIIMWDIGATSGLFVNVPRETSFSFYRVHGTEDDRTLAVALVSEAAESKRS